MSQKQYTPSFITDILDDWDLNQNEAQCPVSLRRFCEEWNVPRSTFQGWLKKRNPDPIPVNRFYAGSTEATEAKKAAIDKEVVEVLRMLASELAAISVDLDEILLKL